MRQRHIQFGAWLAGVVVLAVIANQSHALAQFIARPPVISGEPSVTFPEDRTVMRRLKLAKERIADEDYPQALEVLGSVLAGQDYFFQPRGQGDTYISVKAEARRMIGRMPPAGRETYELAFGAAARRSLRRAIASGDMQLLARVASETFHTQAGYEAMLLLGDDHLDHGSWLAAAGCFRRLLAAPAAVRDRLEPSLSFRAAAALFQAGQHDAAREALQALKQSRPGATFTIAGRETGLFAAGGKPLEWLEGHIGAAFSPTANISQQWAVHRGDAARNAISRDGGSFVHFKWKAPFYIPSAPPGDAPGFTDPLYTDRHVLETIAALEKEQSAPDSWTPLVSQPLRIGDLVVFRTATAIMATDARTGKARWRAAIDDNLQNVIREIGRKPAADDAPNSDPFGAPGRRAVPTSRATAPDANTKLKLGLQRRIWSDRVYGTLASDGQCVYAVEELNLYPGQGYITRVVNGRRVMERIGEEPKSHNRLRAYDLSSGRLLWELSRVQDPAANASAANAFFLGPPLPLAGRLYALVEIAGAVRLVAIDPNPRPEPKVLWTQPLGDVEQNVTQDSLRSLAGASPSYADGVLVCPTASGAVVALDLASQSLLWGYKYRRSLQRHAARRAGGVFGARVIIRVQPNRGVAASAVLPGWCDSSVTIASGHVLISPEGSDELHCLDLLTGAKVWGPTRVEGGQYVACVQDDKAVVVGKQGARVFDLRSGQPGWQTPWPKNALPTGRGFASRGKYHVPLSTGAIATLAVNDGVLNIRKLPSDGESSMATVGSLVCSGDWVYSQTAGDLIGYRLESAKDLEVRVREHPGDMRSVLLLGRIYREQDQLTEAIAQFRRAFESSRDDESRRLLFDTMLLALRRDFRKFRQNTDELTELAAGADERSQLWRTLARALHESGEHDEALTYYLKLTDIRLSNEPLERIGPNLEVAAEPWLRTQLQRLWNDASPGDRQKIDRAVRDRAAALTRNDRSDADSLRRAILCYGVGSLGDELRKARLARLLEADDPPLIEIEPLLRRQIESADKPAARQATQQLAELYAKAGHYTTAARFYERLRSRFANVPGADGRTGQQVYDTLPADGEVRSSVAPRSWPRGKVAVKVENDIRRLSDLVVIGPQGNAKECFRGISFHLDRFRYLEARSPDGRQRWRTEFKRTDRTIAPVSVAYGQRLIAQDHMLVYSNGCYIFGIDGAGGEKQSPGNILWTHVLTDSNGSRLDVGPRVDPFGARPDVVPNPRFVSTPWGERHVRFISRTGAALGTLTPAVTPERVFFLRGHKLLAADLLTGKILWRRDSMPAGSEILAGDGLVAVVDPTQPLARVFRQEDGVEQAARPAPPESQWIAAFGARVLRWRDLGGKVELSLVDVLGGNELWRRTFAAGAKAARAGDKLAVVEPDGSFTMLSTDNGQTAFTAPLDKCENLQNVILLADARRYILALNEKLDAAKLRALGVNRPSSVSGHLSSQPLNGRLQAFDRETGKLLWMRPIEGFSILFNQPPESPALAMQRLARTRQVVNRRATSQWETIVAVVDKRDGRVLYKGTHTGTSIVTVGSLEADVEKRLVRLDSPLGVVSLQFTDEPRDANAPQERLTYDPQPAPQLPNNNPFGAPLPPQRAPFPLPPGVK